MCTYTRYLIAWLRGAGIPQRTRSGRSPGPSLVHLPGVGSYQSASTPNARFVIDSRCGHRPKYYGGMSLASFVLRSLPPPPARVLEIGCGPVGDLTYALAAAGYDIVAVDPVAPEGPLFRRIPFEDFTEPGPFDAVVASLSMHHIADLPRTAERIMESPRPGWAVHSGRVGPRATARRGDGALVFPPTARRRGHGSAHRGCAVACSL